MKTTALLFILVSGSAYAARPYYATETNLASKLETQSEAVASPSTSSLPPLPSRWGAAVLEAVAGGDATKAAIVASVVPEGTMATTTQSAESINQSIQSVIQAGPSPMNQLETLGGSDLAEKTQAVKDALSMVSVALEASGSGKALFTSIAVKGAVTKWNSLVGAAVNRLGALSQRYKEGGAEQKAIQAFLESGQAREVKSVLSSFRTR